jgi:hypothetical protein
MAGSNHSSIANDVGDDLEMDVVKIAATSLWEGSGEGRAISGVIVASSPAFRASSAFPKSPSFQMVRMRIELYFLRRQETWNSLD